MVSEFIFFYFFLTKMSLDMIMIRDDDPDDVKKQILKMNWKTTIYKAQLQYTLDYINSHRNVHMNDLDNEEEDIPPPKPNKNTSPPSKPKDNEFLDRYKMKEFMKEYYPEQRRIPLSEIQKLYKSKKFIQIQQKEMKDILLHIGYKVSDCSHKLIAILDDGFR